MPDTMILSLVIPAQAGIALCFLPESVADKVRSCKSRSDPRLREDDEQKQKSSLQPSKRFNATTSASPIMRRKSVPMPG